jgi:hypothetical protein
MNTTLPLATASESPNGGCFRIRCDAGDDNRFGVHAESLTVTVGQHVLRNDALEMWDSVSIYATQDAEGTLVIEVLVFNPDWDEPLRIVSIRSRPQDATCLTVLGCCLNHVTT